MKVGDYVILTYSDGKTYHVCLNEIRYTNKLELIGRHKSFLGYETGNFNQFTKIELTEKKFDSTLGDLEVGDVFTFVESDLSSTGKYKLISDGLGRTRCLRLDNNVFYDYNKSREVVKTNE